jgi:hypothetical protein
MWDLHMKFESKISRGFYSCFVFLFLIILVFILTNIFFFSDNTNFYTKKIFLIGNRFIFLISLVICIKFSFTNFSNLSFIKKPIDPNSFIIDASILLLIIQLLITYQIFFFPGWDPGEIRRSLNEFVFNNQEILADETFYPFSRYPNNIPLTAILLLTTKLFNFFNLYYYSGWLLGSIFAVNAAGIFTFLCTNIITKNVKYAILSWLFFSSLVALSPWISIPYTDTYVIFFTILTFFLYISLNPLKENLLRWFFIGFCGFLGYLIKPTAIIVIISIIITEILKLTSYKKKIKSDIYQSLIPFLLIILSIIPAFLVNRYFLDITKIDTDKNQKFGILHYAMIGQNPETNGIYSDDDVKFSASFSTLRERNEANIKIIKQRFSNFGLFGYFEFLGRKALVNFSDGTFAWGVEGNFIYQKINRRNIISTFLRDIYYPNGEYYNIFTLIAQILWLVVLIMLLGLGLLWKNPDDKSIALLISLLGISLFVMIFEARARYLYSFTPFFMIGLGISLQRLRNFIDSKKLRNINKN